MTDTTTTTTTNTTTDPNINNKTLLQKYLYNVYEYPKYSKKWFLENTYYMGIFAVTGSSAMILVRYVLANFWKVEGTFFGGPWQYTLAHFSTMFTLYPLVLLFYGTLFGRHQYFKKKNVKDVYLKAIEGGAKAIKEPTLDEYIESAIIQSPFDDLIHTFIHRDFKPTSSNPLILFPDFQPIDHSHSFSVCELPSVPITGSIDHIATCVKNGQLQEFVDWYYRCLDFKLLKDESNNEENEYIIDKNYYVITKSDFRFTTKENVGLKMAVLSNQPASIKNSQIPPIMFVISEAIKEGAGQVEQFIQFNNGPGVQHLAFNTSHIFEAVDYASRNKLEFVRVPNSYYDHLPQRQELKSILPNLSDQDLTNLKKFNILIDADFNNINNGYIKQIFTKSICDSPTIFFELIKRSDALGFGKGNIIALFESMEKETQ
eukprot:gene2017-2484_t